MPQLQSAPVYFDDVLGRPRLSLGEAALFGVSAWAALLIGAPTLRAAEPVSPLAQGLLGMPVRDQAGGAERFSTPDGALRFTLDRTIADRALIRFEGRGEVVALTAATGPHGDEFLKDDTGRVVVRVTGPGGMIVYADVAGGGAPVSAAGKTLPLAAPAPPAGGLAARLAEIERESSRALGHKLAFDPPDAALLTSSAGIALAADAAARAGEALAAVKPAHLSRVAIGLGPHAAARLDTQALYLTIAPPLGYAGRPSADAIEAVLLRAKR